MSTRVPDPPNARDALGDAMGAPVITPPLQLALKNHPSEIKARVADVLIKKKGER